MKKREKVNHESGDKANRVGIKESVKKEKENEWKSRGTRLNSEGERKKDEFEKE